MNLSLSLSSHHSTCPSDEQERIIPDEDMKCDPPHSRIRISNSSVISYILKVNQHYSNRLKAIIEDIYNTYNTVDLGVFRKYDGVELVGGGDFLKDIIWLESHVVEKIFLTFLNLFKTFNIQPNTVSTFKIP